MCFCPLCSSRLLVAPNLQTLILFEQCSELRVQLSTLPNDLLSLADDPAVVGHQRVALLCPRLIQRLQFLHLLFRGQPLVLC